MHRALIWDLFSKSKRTTPSDPPKGAPGGGLGGPRGGYHQISCVMSILGFSIVENPKMTSIFILGYPNLSKGTLRERAGGLQGMLGPILPNIMCYVNSGCPWKEGLK